MKGRREALVEVEGLGEVRVGDEGRGRVAGCVQRLGERRLVGGERHAVLAQVVVRRVAARERRREARRRARHLRIGVVEDDGRSAREPAR